MEVSELDGFGPTWQQRLMEGVSMRDAASVRALFEEQFWRGKPIVPEWQHLKGAIRLQDETMVRLLLTWGARPELQDLVQMSLEAGERHEENLRLLRRGGLLISSAWTDACREAALRCDEVAQRVQMVHRHSVSGIPKEWLGVLAAFRSVSGKEAVIAGGALRDLFNDKAVRDVDIFLVTQGSLKKDRKLIKEAFAAAGLELVPQVEGVSSYGGWELAQKIPDPVVVKNEQNVLAYGGMKSEVEKISSWRVKAGAAQTEYNIVFLDESYARQSLTTALFMRMDAAICQIATDGARVDYTPMYKEDVLGKKITVLRSDEECHAHLKKLAEKYSDWELSENHRRVSQSSPRDFGYS